MSNSNKIWLFLGIFLVVLVLFGFLGIGSSDSFGANVAIIPVDGVIVTQSAGLFDAGAVSGQIVDKIQDANNNAQVEVILIEMNSPGGSAVASEEIVKAIKRSEKPVVSYVRDYGASGGYWVIAATDHIVASPASIVGSVGVNGAHLGFAGLIDQYNISYRQFTAGQFKDIGSPFRDLTDEEQQRLDLKLNLLHDYFVGDVSTLRNLTDLQTEEIRKADFYLGLQGLELGIVDELGGQGEALIYIENTYGIEANAFRMEESGGLVDLFAGVDASTLNPLLIEEFGGFSLR